MQKRLRGKVGRVCQLTLGCMARAYTVASWPTMRGSGTALGSLRGTGWRGDDTTPAIRYSSLLGEQVAAHRSDYPKDPTSR